MTANQCLLIHQLRIRKPFNQLIKHLGKRKMNNQSNTKIIASIVLALAIVAIVSVNVKPVRAAVVINVKVTMAGGYGYSPEVFIVGGNPTPSYFHADGQSHSITIDNGAEYMLYFINGAWNEPNVFRSGIETAGPYFQGVSPDPDLTAYHQYRITPYYTVNYGGAPTVTNVVHYTSCGGAQTSTPTFGASGGTPFWADYDTTVTYDSPIAGAAGEQWKAASGDAGTHTVIASVSASQSATLLYYHQYSVTFDYETNDASAITSGTQMGTYIAFGSPNNINAGATYGVTAPPNAWVDAGIGKVAFSTATVGAQRWAIYSSPLSLDVEESGTLATSSYYHQRQFYVNYEIAGGGTPTAPTLEITMFGYSSMFSPTLTTISTAYWLDDGTPWSVTNPLGGSGVTERWSSSQTISGTVSATSPTTAGGTITFSYYHQYQAPASYTTSDSSTPSQSVILSATQFGAGTYTLTLTTTAQNAWLDAGTTWTINNPIQASPPTEQWIATTGTSGAVGSLTAIAPAYTHQYYVTVDDGSHGAITPTTGYFNQGTDQTFTITPDAGYHIVDVVADGVSQGIQTSWEFTNIQEPHTITASFALDEYTLAFSNVGGGIIYPNSSQTTYHYGDAVQLTAMPFVGWSFAGWSDGFLSVDNPVTVIVNGSISITATFIQNEYPLTVSTAGSGSVSKNPSQTTYHYGDVVELSATASAGYSFSGWSDNFTSSANPVSVIINGSTVLTATFVQNEYTLTINTAGSGLVNKNPNQATYHYGDILQLTANPSTGWSFSAWSGNATGSTNPVSINVTENMEINATFTINQYTLTVAQSSHGTLSPDTTIVDYGASQTFTITPDTGYHITDVIVDGVSKGAVASWEFTDVDSNHQITATFEIDTFTLTVTQGANGVISPGTTTVNYGGSQPFTITPNTGYHIVDVLVDGKSKGAVSSWEFSDVQSSHTLTASFALNEHTLTVTVVGGGSITKNPSQATYHYGDRVNLTANPSAGWAFQGWTGDFTGTDNPATITMDGNKTITATFAKITYTVNFALSGIGVEFAGTAITIDGTDYPASAFPLSFTWDSDSEHSFAFASTLSVDSSKRYVWDSTNGLSNLQSESLTVTGSGTITGNFTTQYLLTVTSAFGAASGGGWYNAGTYAQIYISDIIVLVGNDTCHLFMGWNATVEDSPYPFVYVLLMDEPKTVIANWMTQYRVTFITNPAGSGTTTPQSTWSVAGTFPISAIPNQGYSFTSWISTGDITIDSSLSNKTTMIISGPGMIMADFKSTATPTIIIATLMTTGQTFNVGLGGNITADQMSNMTITPFPANATTIVTFTITGVSGSGCFCNLTLPKSAIPYGTIPQVYIDGELAPNQGYTEDADNYYIWYNTHFSEHEITVEFKDAQPSTAERTYYVEIAAIIISAALLVATLLMRLTKRKTLSRAEPFFGFRNGIA